MIGGLVLFAGLALAACGGGGEGSSGETGSSSETAATAASETQEAKLGCGLGNGEKATGKPISVGAVVTASGGVDFSDAVYGAQAFFDCVNDNGGINGRPVDYTYEDDALNPEQATQAAAKEVDDRHAVALIGSTSQIDCAVNGPYYEKHDIVAIYGTGVPQQCFESPNIAPVNAGPRLGAIRTAQYVVEQGAKSLAVVAPDVPGVGEWVVSGVEEWAQAHGVDLAKAVLTPPGIKDGTSVVLQAASSNPDAIIFVLPGEDNVTFLKAAQQQNLKGRAEFACLSPCYEPKFPATVGDYWSGLPVNAEFQLLDAHTPDNDLWREVMAKYEPDKSADAFSQGGMLAAMIFTETMLKVKDPETIDRSLATRMLRAVKDFKTDLTCSPFTFGSGTKHDSDVETRMVSMEGGGFKEVQGCVAAEDPGLEQEG